MIRSIDSANFLHKRVLVRVDFNVPLDDSLRITDDTRIAESLPTIDRIIDGGGIPILMSHLGRPKGAPNPKYSLAPVAEHLRNVYGYKVIFAQDCIGEAAQNAVKQAKLRDIVLLENLRFHAEEEKNDQAFAAKIAELGNMYVNEAFGSDHRAHASTDGVPRLFGDRYAGYLLQNEIEYLGNAVRKPQRPFTAVLGGAKISGKIDVIKNLMGKCDSILIGGGMMFTFYKAMGLEIGKSILEADKVDLAREIIAEAKEKGMKLLLPVDCIAASEFSESAQTKTVPVEAIPADMLGMDIGPKSIELFEREILASRTIVWNGPMGVFEMPKFAEGTFSLAKAVGEATSKGAISVVGGGDSVAAVKAIKYEKKITHVSTGGGASLEFLEGKELPGIAVLDY